VGRSQFQSERIGRMFDLPVLSGAGFGCQRWLWDQVGGIDEDFGATGEDFDFSMRIFEETGIEPVLVPGATYHYRLRSGGRGTFRQSRRYGESHAQLYARHGRGRVEVKANTLGALRDWWWIASRAPLAAFGKRRENWATHAGRRVGRLVGSIRYRVLWL
jgi:GT2 family glycosyltransferase